MNRNLLVTLLRKNIEELEMITEGFMEMSEYPKAIILLAQRKTEDIQSYIRQLAEIKTEQMLEPADGSSMPEDFLTREWIIESELAEKPDASDTVELIQEEIDSTLQIANQPSTPASEDFQPQTVDHNRVDIEPNVGESVKSDIAELVVEMESPAPSRMTFLNAREVPYSRNESLAGNDNSISNSLANKKISDIKQAISIGERFRFQRELFRGNGEDMNKTLTYINQLATLDEVMAFLQSKYNWPEENETATIFYQIVKRRF